MIAICMIMSGFIVVIILMLSLGVVVMTFVMAVVAVRAMAPVVTYRIPVIDITQGFMRISHASKVLGSRTVI